MFLKKTGFWVLAVFISAATMIYQRKTGPTYPRSYELSVDGESLQFSLPRSHGGDGNCTVAIAAPEQITGKLLYRRFPGESRFDTLLMERSGDSLYAELPHQAPAGKLEYHLELYHQGVRLDLGDKENVVIRFKGGVPVWALVPHILLMIFAMLWSNATALLALGKLPQYKKHMHITILLFLVGGFIFGPIVQYYAFGDFWTGWPNGKDLTDNKVLIAIIIWLAAWLLNRKKERRWAVVLAALILLAIYLIPHSMNGSELDYESGEVVTGALLLPLVTGTGFARRLKSGSRSLFRR